jgi:mannosyltransferase OCH1-like enzyme
VDEAQQIKSPYLSGAIGSVKRGFPQYDHKIFFHQELREWIFENYGANYRHAFDKIRPYAFKSDFARYLLLFHYGGWYFDISIKLLQGVNIQSSIDFITFAEESKYSRTSFSCSNGIIYSKAQSPILENCIDRCFLNIKNEYYGRLSLDITGPTVLGRAVAAHNDALNVVVGSFIELTPGFGNKNRAFVFNDGRLFGLHKPGNKGGDLTALNLKGTNNYDTMYKEKQVFDINIHI